MSKHLFKLAEKFKVKYGQLSLDDEYWKNLREKQKSDREKQKSDYAWQQAVSKMPQFLINAVGQPVKDPKEITKVQEALLNKGQKMEAGADGIWGRQTFSALWGFQYKNKLPTTGTLNQQTVTALGLQ
jgi:type I site-specific restriction-modification system R (restriction) subunit